MALKSGKHIDEITYWKWRFYMEHAQHEHAKLNTKNKFNAVMEKDIEIAKLKLQLYKQQIKDQMNKAREATDSYQKIKLEIEDKIGMSLDDCSICDETFEIIALNEEALEDVKDVNQEKPFN